MYCHKILEMKHCRSLISILNCYLRGIVHYTCFLCWILQQRISEVKWLPWHTLGNKYDIDDNKQSALKLRFCQKDFVGKYG